MQYSNGMHYAHSHTTLDHDCSMHGGQSPSKNGVQRQDTVGPAFQSDNIWGLQWFHSHTHGILCICNKWRLTANGRADGHLGPGPPKLSRTRMQAHVPMHHVQNTNFFTASSGYCKVLWLSCWLAAMLQHLVTRSSNASQWPSNHHAAQSQD